jgi:hypothetical protein
MIPPLRIRHTSRACRDLAMNLQSSPAARRAPVIALALALSACATPPPPAPQTLDVRIEAEDPAWAGPLQCVASNGAGRWSFAAPGPVTVLPSDSPLQVICQAPQGAVADVATGRSAPSAKSRAEAKEATAAGAKVGAGAGVAVGLAAVPVLGPGVAVLLLVGSTLRGAEIGGLVHALRSGVQLAYPATIVVRVHRAAP